MVEKRGRGFFYLEKSRAEHRLTKPKLLTCNNSNNSKGQMTIFVILGLVMFFAFGFALYARSLVVNAQLQADASNAVSQALETTPITYYVTKCLQEATNDAVTTIALQGGRIYDFQGGTTEFDASKNGTDWVSTYIPEYDRSVIISYGMKQQSNSSCVQTDIPIYPYNKTYSSEWMLKYFLSGCSLNSGVFGDNSLPKLCSEDGANRRNVSNITCLPSIYAKNHTVQQELENFIAIKLENCANLSLFQEQLGNNISVQDAPKVTVTFSKNGFYVNAAYPFMVVVRGKLPVVKMVNFQINSMVPFKELYTFLYRLAVWDSGDMNFNPETNYTSVGQYYSIPYFNSTSIRKIRNVCPECADDEGKYSDLLELKDNAITINGKPLVFYYAIQNRLPALDYIHATSPDSTYDVTAREGQEVFITPNGYDPDDGSLIYNYSGWKQTEDSWLDVNCCQATGDCVLNPARCTRTDMTIQPYNWTNSTPYKNTQRVASYFVTALDAGMHHVFVYITKEGKLFDYQDVAILIFDLPKAKPQIGSIYDDIETGKSSIEDFFWLNGSASSISQVGGGTFTSFVWLGVWHDDPAEKTLPLDAETVDTPNALIEYPDQLLAEDKAILLIQDPSLPTQYAWNKVGKHDLTLTVNTKLSDGTPIASDPSTTTVDVYECLPHFSDTPSWPYSTGPDTGNVVLRKEAFESNHTCCSNGTAFSRGLFPWGDILDSRFQCYFEDDYGSQKALDDHNKIDDDLGDHKYPSDHHTILYLPDENNVEKPDPVSGGLFYDTYEAQNDVYHATFQRNCSGTRGNICGGDIVERRTLQDNCPDSGKDGHFCSGPSTDQVAFGSGTVTCMPYGPGENFRKTHLNEAVGGWCDNTPKISQLDNSAGGLYSLNGYDNPDGRFECKGYCDGSGSCNAVSRSDCTCKAVSGNGGSPACDGLTAETLYTSEGQCQGNTWCGVNCDANTNADSSKDVCNCIYHQGDCANSNDANCWIGGSCCETSTQDTYQVATGSGCIQGHYLTGTPDSSPEFCAWATGYNFDESNPSSAENTPDWFSSQSQCCNGGTAEKLFEPGKGCCYDGSMINENTKSGKAICSYTGLSVCDSSSVGSEAYIQNGLAQKKYTCDGTKWV